MWKKVSWNGMRGIILGILIYEWEKDLHGLQKIVNFNNLIPLRVEVEVKFDIFRLSSQSVNNIHNN